ncbi:MAG TPA: glycosyltransferase [Candidatus Nanoarchaeia archaeon]|nr:glycosyltransferase [Candidatus Nanoarchaeia archaeon]
MIIKKVTVGVPVYNEEKTILKSLYAIHRAILSTKLPIELIICINGTTDHSETIARTFSNKIYPLKIIRSKKGKAKAVKALGTAAKGDIVIFTDADAILAEDCLKKLIEGFSDSEIKAVTGRPVPLPLDNVIYQIINARMLHPEAEIARTPILGNSKKPFLHGRLYAVRKDIFRHNKDIDTMDNSIGDDTYLTHYLFVKYGRKAIKCVEEAHTYYLPVQSIRFWWYKWSRIWCDLDQLYRENPHFLRIKPTMKTKIDWKYVSKLPLKIKCFFVLERILHHSGHVLYEISKHFKKVTWVRLSDTKEVNQWISKNGL